MGVKGKKKQEYMLQSLSVQIPLKKRYSLTLSQSRVLGHIRFVIREGKKNLKKERVYFFSNTDIASVCGISCSATSRAVIALVKKGLVRTEYSSKKGGGTVRQIFIEKAGDAFVKKSFNKKTEQIKKGAKSIEKSIKEGMKIPAVLKECRTSYPDIDTTKKNWLKKYSFAVSKERLSLEANDFIMGNSPYCVQAQREYGLSLSESHVYGLITFILGGKNKCNSFYYTNKEIAKSLDMSYRTVAYSIKKLRRIQVITSNVKYSSVNGGMVRKINLTKKSLDESWYSGDEVEREVRGILGNVFKDKRNSKKRKNMIKLSSIPPIKKKKSVVKLTDLEKKLLDLYGEKVSIVPRSLKAVGHLKAVKDVIAFAESVGAGEKEILQAFHSFVGTSYFRASVKPNLAWRRRPVQFFGFLKKGIVDFVKNKKNDKKSLAVCGRNEGSSGVRKDKTSSEAWRKRKLEADRVNYELDKKVYAKLPKERQEHYGGWEGYNKKYRELYGWM